VNVLSNRQKYTGGDERIQCPLVAVSLLKISIMRITWTR